MGSGKSTNYWRIDDAQHISATFPGESHLLPGVASTFRWSNSPRNPFKALRSLIRSRGFFFPGAFFSVYTHNQSTAVVNVRTNGANVLCLLSHVPDCHSSDRSIPRTGKDRINPPHRHTTLSMSLINTDDRKKKVGSL